MALETVRGKEQQKMKQIESEKDRRKKQAMKSLQGMEDKSLF